MDIEKTKYSDLEILKGWFPDQASSYFWGGPGLRFPFTLDSFLKDIQWEQMPSYSLLDDAGEFAGFGQYYEKLGRCHLARLAISPALRGKGHGHWFISRLMNIGMKSLDTSECSLFVLDRNKKALRCYTVLGFKKEEHPPGHQSFPEIDFMVFKNSDGPIRRAQSTSNKLNQLRTGRCRTANASVARRRARSQSR